VTVSGPRSIVNSPQSPVVRPPFLAPRSSFILRSSFFVLASLLLLAGSARGQGSQSGTAPLSQGPVFKYYVWGQVRSPGTYNLGPSPDVLELLSAAGGPTENADVQHVVLFQAYTQKQIKIDLKKMLGSGQVIPLSPGDVVIVPNSPWYALRYGLSVVSTVASLATLALVVMNWVTR